MSIYFYFGTTAEYIKLSPVLKAFQKNKIKYKIILSGQTTVNLEEISKIAGKQSIYKNFEGKVKKSSPFAFLAWSAKTFVKSIYWSLENLTKDDILIVHGDTVSTLIGSIMGKLRGMKVVHIEAGLRTHNLLEPFPEEISRTLVGYIADVNFCPNKAVFGNIGRKSSKKVSTEYNTSVEALNGALKIKQKKSIISGNQKYFIFIVHRQEHLFIGKDRTKDLIALVINNINPKIKCVFIIHDITRNYLKEIGLWTMLSKNKNVILQPRLPYVEFMHLFKSAEYIISDGGGNHTEAHYLGKPCLIFRNSTEQSEGLNENVILAKDNKKRIAKFMKEYKKHQRPVKKIKIWPSEIIVNELASYLKQ